MNRTHYGKFKIWKSAKGYPNIWIDGKSVPLHVYVWEQKNGSKPKGYDIHHIDRNKSNYKIENLLLVTPSQHRRIHSGWVWDENRNWIKKPCNRCKTIQELDRFHLIRTRNIQQSICKECVKETQKERRRKPNYQKNHNEYLRKWRAKRRAE